MIIKNIFLIITFSLFIISCATTEIKDKTVVVEKKEILERETVSNELLSDINHVLFLLKQNDLETLNNRFIHPTFGFFELIKDENKKIVIKEKFQLEEISDDIESFDIKEEEVVFNCSPYDDRYYGWSKEGVFLVPSDSFYLSELIKKDSITNTNLYSSKIVEKVSFVDKRSYEITIPYNIVFYLTKIDKQWYITLINYLKTDCSE